MNSWILFLAGRYLRSTRKEKGLSHSFFSILGLSVGVMTLIAVLGVMNGFQLGFIEDILEVSSTHLRLPAKELWTEEQEEEGRKIPGIRTLYPMVDSQTLVQSTFSGPLGAFIRGLPPEALTEDQGLADHLEWVEGRGELKDGDSILLGADLARRIGVSPGDRVGLLALAGPGFSLLRPQTREFTVEGLFRTGYGEMDGAWAFVSLQAALEFFAGEEDLIYGVKLHNPEEDLVVKARLETAYPGRNVESWRDYNRSFFGALRLEKSAMMILIGLIFLIVGANIRQSQQRTLKRRQEDIGLLKAVGGSAQKLRLIFILEGLLVGLLSGVVGTGVGVLVTWNINPVLEGLQFFLTWITGLFGPEAVGFRAQAFYLDQIPVRILWHEVALIFLFAVLSSTLSAWAATRSVLKLRPADVLKAE